MQPTTTPNITNALASGFDRLAPSPCQPDQNLCHVSRTAFQIGSSMSCAVVGEGCSRQRSGHDRRGERLRGAIARHITVVGNSFFGRRRRAAESAILAGVKLLAEATSLGSIATRSFTVLSRASGSFANARCTIVR